METTYTLTEDEYVRANKLFTKPTKNILLFYGSVCALSVIAFVLSDTLKDRTIIAGALLGGFIGQAIARHAYAPWQTRKQFRDYKAAQEPITINNIPEGVFFKSKIGEATIAWDRIIKWREDEEFILLYQAHRVYHIIPKRIGETGNLIREALHKHVGNAI